MCGASGEQLIVQESDLQAEPFSDLDEIYARYVAPMNDYVSSMVNHPAFRYGTIAEVSKCPHVSKCCSCFFLVLLK